MKELLEDFFGKHYKSTKRAIAESRFLQGNIELSDSKACDDCRRHSYEIEVKCNKVVLKCNSSEHIIEVVELENFINQFAHLKALPSRRKCDLLLVGDDKIVFCDMSCTKAVYIDPYLMNDQTPKMGKRIIAMEQITSSVGLLMQVPQIASEIKNKKDKIALFAYRKKSESAGDDFDKSVSHNINAFNVMGNIVFQEPMFTDIGNDFFFTEICYPNTYIW